jgi:uncharacterized protein YegP (UPF0339 family)
MIGKFVLKRVATGEFLFELKAETGKTLLTSKPHTSRTSAVNAIESVRECSTNREQFDRRTSKKIQPFFTLNTPSNGILGISGMYSSVASMENGIKSVMKNGSSAPLIDLTQAGIPSAFASGAMFVSQWVPRRR